MKRVAVTVDIRATPSHIWNVWEAVEQWPEWTSSISEIRPLQGRPWKVGSVFEIRQPRLPKSKLTITRFEPGRCFVWESRTPLLRVAASHEADETSTGSRVTLSVEYAGFFGRLAAAVFGKVTREYVAIEARGLKARAESATSWD